MSAPYQIWEHSSCSFQHSGLSVILSLLSAALTHTNLLAAPKTCLCPRTAGAQQHKSCLAALAHYLWKSHSTVCCIMRASRRHNQHLTPTLWYHLVPPNLELEPRWKPECPHLNTQEGIQWSLHISHIRCRRNTALFSYSRMKLHECFSERNDVTNGAIALFPNDTNKIRLP